MGTQWDYDYSDVKTRSMNAIPVLQEEALGCTRLVRYNSVLPNGLGHGCR
jgi:hypothetical protein